MATITAKDVAALRERTGAGMMDCKKALMACEGDVEKAIDFLREKGLAAAAKKAGRIAAEGVVADYRDGDVAVLVADRQADRRHQPRRRGSPHGHHHGRRHRGARRVHRRGRHR